MAAAFGGVTRCPTSFSWLYGFDGGLAAGGFISVLEVLGGSVSEVALVASPGKIQAPGDHAVDVVNVMIGVIR